MSWNDICKNVILNINKHIDMKKIQTIKNNRFKLSNIVRLFVCAFKQNYKHIYLFYMFDVADHITN